MDSLRGHLVDVCRQARDDAGASKTRIAAAINRGEQSVSRFEQGVGGWHTQTGELVDAYAQVAGIPPWELWQMAIDRWRQAPAASAPDAHNGNDTAEAAGSQRRLRTSVRSGSKEHPPQADEGPQRKSG